MKTTQIVKSKTTENFTIVPNSIIQNAEISMDAKAVLCYLLSLPSDWVLYKFELIKHFKEGKHRVLKAFNELIELDYIVAIPQFNGNLRAGYNYIVYSEPVNDNSRTAEIRTSEARTSEDQLLQSTNSTKEKKTKKKKENMPIEKIGLHSELKDLFLSAYRTKYGSEYYWTAKDATNLNLLIKKIEFKVREKFPEEQSTRTKIVDTFRLLLNSISDKWILSNFSIPTINSKFNEIITQIKSNYGRNNNHDKSINQQFIETFGHLYPEGNIPNPLQS